MLPHSTPHVRIERQGARLEVTITRKDVRNAFDAQTIADLTAVFRASSHESALRVLILRGEGETFCAGADLRWMQEAARFSEAQNLKDAERLGELFASFSDIPFSTIAVVQGAALGGGCGLLACADIGLVETTARFGFTEVRLGIVPAVISPFLAKRLTKSAMLRYFQTGEIFDGQLAVEMGLASQALHKDELDKKCEEIVSALLSVAPNAARVAKRLAQEAGCQPLAQARKASEALIAMIRSEEEAKEGMDAFLNKRQPNWRETRED
jgi:methylglutaconyl-CoA hydratase